MENQEIKNGVAHGLYSVNDARKASGLLRIEDPSCDLLMIAVKDDAMSGSRAGVADRLHGNAAHA